MSDTRMSKKNPNGKDSSVGDDKTSDKLVCGSQSEKVEPLKQSQSKDIGTEKANFPGQTEAVESGEITKKKSVSEDIVTEKANFPGQTEAVKSGEVTEKKSVTEDIGTEKANFPGQTEAVESGEITKKKSVSEDLKSKRRRPSTPAVQRRVLQAKNPGGKPTNKKNIASGSKNPSQPKETDKDKVGAEEESVIKPMFDAKELKVWEKIKEIRDQKKALLDPTAEIEILAKPKAKPPRYSVAEAKMEVANISLRIGEPFLKDESKMQEWSEIFERKFRKVKAIDKLEPPQHTFENVVTQIKEQMGGTWQSQLMGLRTLRALCMEISYEPKEPKNEEKMHKFLKEMYRNLENCMVFDRTKLFTEACVTLAFLVREYREKLEMHYIKVMINNLLPRMNASSIFATMAKTTLKYILQYIHVPSLFMQLMKDLDQTKGQNVQAAVAHLMITVLEYWTPQEFKPCLDSFEQAFITLYRADIKCQVPLRVVFWMYNRDQPVRAKALYKRLRSSDQDVMDCCKFLPNNQPPQEVLLPPIRRERPDLISEFEDSEQEKPKSLDENKGDKKDKKKKKKNKKRSSSSSSSLSINVSDSSESSSSEMAEKRKRKKQRKHKVNKEMKKYLKMQQHKQLGSGNIILNLGEELKGESSKPINYLLTLKRVNSAIKNLLPTCGPEKEFLKEDKVQKTPKTRKALEPSGSNFAVVNKCVETKQASRQTIRSGSTMSKEDFRLVETKKKYHSKMKELSTKKEELQCLKQKLNLSVKELEDVRQKVLKTDNELEEIEKINDVFGATRRSIRSDPGITLNRSKN